MRINEASSAAVEKNQLAVVHLCAATRQGNAVVQKMSWLAVRWYWKDVAAEHNADPGDAFQESLWNFFNYV